MHASRRTSVAIATVLFAVAACKSKPAPAPAPMQAPPQERAAAPRVNQDSIDRARAAAADAERRRLADEETRRNAAAIAEMKNTLGAKVYFDYDKDEIRDDQRAVLDAKVPILTANANVRIRVAGNTDDRGSDEYNLALGQRRAASAKRYLVSRGIAESRIETVSFGEEHPVAQGETESAWSQNRRDEFEITAGGDTMKPVR